MNAAIQSVSGLYRDLEPDHQHNRRDPGKDQGAAQPSSWPAGGGGVGGLWTQAAWVPLVDNSPHPAHRWDRAWSLWGPRIIVLRVYFKEKILKYLTYANFTKTCHYVNILLSPLPWPGRGLKLRLHRISTSAHSSGPPLCQ